MSSLLSSYLMAKMDEVSLSLLHGNVMKSACIVKLDACKLKIRIE